MTPEIQVEKVTKSYGTTQALTGVDLTVEKGELFCIIGPDGAGKSTLYHILATLLAPDSGTATLAGLDTLRDSSKLRTRIGYMPDRFSLYPDLSIKENLHFFAALYGVHVEDNFDLIKPIFESQLAKFPNRFAGNLSGGMKQKLALCCSLIHRPEVLLLDEPTTGVDIESRREFWQMLKGLRKQGITILVSTSYMDEASECDRLALMDNGKIVACDKPEALIGNIGETIYNARSKDMFHLLEELRARSDVEFCYTFGATLHVVVKPGFNAEEVTNQLKAKGLDDAVLSPAEPSLEDLFIKFVHKYGE